jgi:CRP-like cAMP-binding protein
MATTQSLDVVREHAGRNDLIGGLPVSTLDRLLARARTKRLERQDQVFDVGQPLAWVYFPTTSVISLLTVLRDGSAIETATVGREGMVGVPVFLGDDHIASCRGVTQMQGVAIQVSVATFLDELDQSVELREHVSQYTRTLLVQISQSVACGTAHDVRQRLARWLLQTSDRARRNEVDLTQQFLAHILHVRRASVTEAAGSLQEDGLIRVRRGGLKIVNREGLTRAACECYGVVADQFLGLLKDA